MTIVTHDNLGTHDELSRILGRDDDSTRFNNFIWAMLLHLYATISPGELNFPPHDRDSLARLINHYKCLSAIKPRMDQGLLPEKHFDWINEKNPRQLKWLENYFCQYPNPLCTDMANKPYGKYLIYAFLDTNLKQNQENIIILENAERHWNYYINNNDRHFRWLNGKDKIARQTYTWEWLNNHQYIPPQFQGLAIHYNTVMMAFDLIPPDTHPVNRFKVLEAIKKAWNQNVRRKNNFDKTQINLYLRNETIKLLDRMANEHDLSRSVVLDFLIRSEAKNQHRLIKEREKRINQFLDD